MIVPFSRQGHSKESHVTRDGPLLRGHLHFRADSEASFGSSKFELAQVLNQSTYFIDEISSLYGPSPRDVLALDLNLFG